LKISISRDPSCDADNCLADQESPLPIVEFQRVFHKNPPLEPNLNQLHLFCTFSSYELKIYF